jgi:hypothetical protein
MDPLVLSEVNTTFTRPVIEADLWGNIHVFWADLFENDSSLGEDVSEKGDTLYHMFWDGHQWSEPLDIFIKDPEALSIVHPRVSTDKEGNIYLIWSGGTGLYFSHSMVLDAHDASKWQKPTIIVDDPFIDESWMIIDSEGNIHIIYSQIRSGQTGISRLAYIKSMDKGKNWSLPIALQEIEEDVEIALSGPRIVIDNRGWIHAVWDERSSPLWIGQRVMYSRSEDGGNNWIPAETIAEIKFDELWASNPSLVALPDGSLHLVWVCGTRPSRCYQESTNNGEAWSSPVHIFGDLHSRAGWDAMVGDTEGTLHLIAQLRYPKSIYYATKPAGDNWNEPITLVSQIGFEDGHNLQAVISGGNKLHAVWQKSAQEGSPTYVMITTNSPAIQYPTPQIKNMTSIPTQSPVISKEIPSLEATRVVESNNLTWEYGSGYMVEPKNNWSISEVLLVGGFSSASLIFIVFTIKRMRKFR